MSVEIVPLILTPEGKAVNPRLFELAKNYAGDPAHLAKPMVWCAVQPEGKNGGGKIVGLASVSYVLDVTFHSDSPEATLRLFRRASERLLDSGLDRVPLLVYIEPGREQAWNPLLARLGAKPANR